jgi:hypothetical protein
MLCPAPHGTAGDRNLLTHYIEEVKDVKAVAQDEDMDNWTG